MGFDIFNAISECLTGCADQPDDINQTTNEEKSLWPKYRDQEPLNQRSADDVALDIVTAIRLAQKPDSAALKPKLDDLVSATGWTEKIAQAVLRGVEKVINEGAKMAQGMREALDRAVKESGEFAKEHPVYCTILALGVLVTLAPWVLEALGFGALGPIEGTFASAWQARYAGYVPKGSLFSFFQRLGMVWKHTVGI